MTRLASLAVFFSMLTASAGWTEEPKRDEPRPEAKEPAVKRERFKAAAEERAALERDQDRLAKRIEGLKKEVEELKQAGKADQAERLQGELQQSLIKYAMVEEEMERMRRPGAVPPARGRMPGMTPFRPGMNGAPGMMEQPGMSPMGGMPPGAMPGPGMPGMRMQGPGMPGMRMPGMGMPGMGMPAPEQRRTHLNRALEHLHQAAAELKAGGFPEVAEHVSQQTQQIEKELRPRAEGGELQRTLNELREEIQLLRRDLNVLRRQMREDR